MNIKAYIRNDLISDVIVLLVVGAIMSVPSMVLAQEDEASPPNRERILNHFDKDGDGALNDREKLHARKFIARKKNSNGDNVDRPDVRPTRDFRERLDRNNDGQLGARERAAGRRMQARRNQ